MIEREPGISLKIEAVRKHAQHMRDQTRWDEEREMAKDALIILFKDTGINAIYELIHDSSIQTTDSES